MMNPMVIPPAALGKFPRTTAKIMAVSVGIMLSFPEDKWLERFFVIHLLVDSFHVVYEIVIF